MIETTPLAQSFDVACDDRSAQHRGLVRRFIDPTVFSQTAKDTALGVVMLTQVRRWLAITSEVRAHRPR